MVMAHGLNSVLKRGPLAKGAADTPTGKASSGSSNSSSSSIGSRRIFPPHFKLQVLDSYRNDADCKGNQRATARKYGIHRRQIQKWLQAESNLRSSVVSNGSATRKAPAVAKSTAAGGNCAEASLSQHRQRDDSGSSLSSLRLLQQQQQQQQHDVADREAYSPGASPSHAAPRCPLDTTALPMDLSLKRPSSAPAAAEPQQPQQHQPAAVTAVKTETHPDIWDLSNKTAPSKPLFKPYLLDDPTNKNNCSSPGINNNNNTYEYSYHELQPKVSYQQQQQQQHQHHRQMPYPHHYGFHSTLLHYSSTLLEPKREPSPLMGYVYDESGVLQPTHATAASPYMCHRQYTLDLKLRAIHTYYQDEFCKGRPGNSNRRLGKDTDDQLREHIDRHQLHAT